MTLTVIGSGLGRTGTKSLQVALNTLGFGPCHHLQEVVSQPNTIGPWLDAARGSADWETIFAGYRSAVDYPTTAYWRTLADYYPDAKIIHTIRDPEEWFESTQATIFSPESPAARARAAGVNSPQLDLFESFTSAFAEGMHDRDYMIRYYHMQMDDVVASLPAERLLIYSVAEGWPPLCAFLGVPVPDEPFPHENTRSEFRSRVMGSKSPSSP